MQSPEVILSNLQSKSTNQDFRFKRLYRYFYNEEFYYKAYYEMASIEGNMTPGTDGKTIDGMSIQRIKNLMGKMKDYSYKPNPVRRIEISKQNTKEKRPLGIPAFEDKLIQMIIKYILEAIYDENFSVHSHGFRPNRGCHSALKEICLEFNGAKWFLEGDIKGFFDNINHQTLSTILRKRIEDEHFIGLIWKFLKAGYMDNERKHTSSLGAPQGAICSPILSNIYLNELDSYMEKLIREFNVGKKSDRKKNTEYCRLSLKLARLNAKMRKNWDILNEDEKRVLLEERNSIRKAKIKLPYYVSEDIGYRRLKYVRYADDFICGISGSKKDVIALKGRISEFLSNNLNLELSEEKTLITHSSQKARFLGYDIVVSRNQDVKRDKNGNPKRQFNLTVRMYIPYDIWRNKLLDLGALEIKYCNQKEIWMPTHRTYLMNFHDLEIINQYNAEIRGLHNYYKYANNSTVLQKFKYVMEYSMYKTFAGKYRTSIGNILKKYKVGQRFGVSYNTKKGSQTCFFYDKSFAHINIRKRSSFLTDAELTSSTHTRWRSDFTERLTAQECELCGQTDEKLEMHHVRKLKDLKGKSEWEKAMICRKRKTLAVCHKCHTQITNQQRNDSKSRL